MEELFLENYWVKSEIGRGTISTVFRAVNSRTGKEVALKKFFLPKMLLESQRKQKFESYRREFEPVLKLDHPNIVKAIDLIEEKDQLFLEMEFLEGQTIATINKEGTPLKLSEGLHIFLKSAEALAYAHKNGVYHRYLKPSNIMITTDGEVKVGDFGTHVFNVIQDLKDIDSTVAPPRIITYFSPEQIRNENYDERSDVFSLAAVMYELFTGRVPFTAHTREQLEIVIQFETPISPRALNPNIPEIVDYILLKAMNKDPKLRHRDMDELTRDIAYLFDTGKIIDTGIRAGGIKKIKGRIISATSWARKTLGSAWRKVSAAGQQENNRGSGTSIYGETRVISENQGARATESKNDLGYFPRKPTFQAGTDSPTSSNIQIAPMELKSSLARNVAARKNAPTRQIVTKETTYDLSDFIELIKNYRTSIIATIILISLFFILKPIVASRRALPGNNMVSAITESPTANPSPSPTEGGSARQGILSIVCDVPAALIVLQNYDAKDSPPIERRTGEAGEPTEIKAPAGVYVLRIEKEMYRPYEARIELMAGQIKIIRAGMERKEPRLQVFTTPSDAKIYLNSSFYGRSPLTLYDIRYGKYKLVIKKEGYDNVEADVEIKQGVPVIMNRELKKTPEPVSSPKASVTPTAVVSTKNSSITISTNPLGAKVLLDGKIIGYTPITRYAVSPGKRFLVITRDNFKTVEREIEIASGTTKDIYIEMSPDNEPPPQANLPTSLPTIFNTPDYPEGKTRQGRDPRTPITSSSPEKKIKVIVNLVFTDGIAYDKLDRKTIVLSFDKKALASAAEKALGMEKDVEITEKTIEADYQLKFYFAVGVNTETASVKPSLTLYSAVLLTNLKKRIHLYQYSDKVPLPFPTGSNLERDDENGNPLGSNRYAERKSATTEATIFLEKQCKIALEELRNLDSEGKKNTPILPERHIRPNPMSPSDRQIEINPENLRRNPEVDY